MACDKFGDVRWGRATFFVVLFVVLLAAGCAAPRAETRRFPLEGTYYFWEAEDIPPSDTNFNRKIHARDQAYRYLLSGNDWLTNWTKDLQPGVSARWKIQVPEAGRYYLYARKYWYHGPFEWRIDSGPWHPARRVGLLDQVDLGSGTSMSWVGLGQTENLSTEQHTFEVQLVATPERYIGDDNWGERDFVDAAAFDCFILSKNAIFPHGRLEPDSEENHTSRGYWAFEPPTDRPQDPSPMDLSFLNKDEHGDFATKTVTAPKGSELFFADERGDGQKLGPQRFWGVVVGANAVYMDESSVAYLADKLAKAGVNLVRVHAPVIDWNAEDPSTVDAVYLDKLQHFVSTMKSRGIYTALSIYFPNWFNCTTLGIQSFHDPKRKPWGLVFYDVYLQGLYRSWAEKVLTTANPHDPDGIPLGEDPALVEWEITNDDNLFTWSFTPGQGMPAEATAPLQKEFDGWLRSKYGSIDAARGAWQGKAAAPQRPQEQDGGATVPLMSARDIRSSEQPGDPAEAARVDDQVWFLADTMYKFYDKMTQDIGKFTHSPAFGGGTTYWNPYGGPWDPWNRYGDTACPVMERHCYWPKPGDQPGQNRTKVKAGDVFKDVAAIEDAEDLPVREYQYTGHQHMLAEYCFPMINRYRSDSVYLASVYGALQGTDAICFFSLSSPAWDNTLPKWPVMTPSVFGQFPAFALAFRRGDLLEESVVKHQNFQKGGHGKVPDPDPLDFYVGRVTRQFTDGASGVQGKDVHAFADRSNRRVHSMHGSAVIDYGDGVAWAKADSFQAATGRLRNLPNGALPAVTLTDPPEYGCVAVISLGETPEDIKKAPRLLVQVMTEETNYGWLDTVEGEDMRKVITPGPGPIIVKDIRGTITIKRSAGGRGLTVRPLDPNGHEMKGLRLRPGFLGNAITIELQPQVMYYVIEAGTSTAQ